MEYIPLYCIYSSNCILTIHPHLSILQDLLSCTPGAPYLLSAIAIRWKERRPVTSMYVKAAVFPVSTEFAIQVFSVYALPLVISVQKETTF